MEYQNAVTVCTLHMFICGILKLESMQQQTGMCTNDCFVMYASDYTHAAIPESKYTFWWAVLQTVLLIYG